jgi:putative aldouronate transport system permease protein
LSESARIDGAKELRIFLQIYLPLSVPGLATIFFLEFVSKWNSLTIPVTIITEQRLYTLPLLLKSMVIKVTTTSAVPPAPENAVMAAIVISTLPLLAIYVFAQKFLISGITLGASKE